jgi:6-pyruvoyltetrahydropterin/6-carboxytetrahydropterin synthase
MITCSRYHDISCGHRVVGGGKCENLHGHNYRIHFTCAADEELNNLGMVVDFAVIKTVLCAWLEDQWDHRFLMWDKDPLTVTAPGVLRVPFNPTAENMAQHLLTHTWGLGDGVSLIGVVVEETRKCKAEAVA